MIDWIRCNAGVRNALRPAVLLLAMLAGASAQAAGDAVATLQRYLDSLSSFEATFRQEVTDSRGKVTKAGGRLYLQKPGRFRWDYLKPDKQVIVSDGRNLWLYDEDLEQVTVKSVDESLSSTPALLLAGKAGVADSFTVTDAGVRAGLHWLRLVPRRGDTDFAELALGFAQDALRVMELSDKLGQRTHIEFEDIKRNPRLEQGLFAFQPPDGVDVIGTPR